MSVPPDTCLQCQQSSDEVKTHNTFCGIEEGYEYRELVAEWPRHHWRDWSDKELRDQGIEPDRFEANRRSTEADLIWVRVEQRCASDGHVQPDPELDIPGRCARCYRPLSASESGEPHE